MGFLDLICSGQHIATAIIVALLNAVQVGVMEVLRRRSGAGPQPR